MVNLGNRRNGKPALVKADGSETKLTRILFTEKVFDEAWIQETIRANPEILPVAEIEPTFASLVSIGMEVPTKTGSIDNLYLNPQGYLTIVETKLWRNPEARREVVGQIIEYAKDISHWSLDDLEERVRSYNQKYRGSDLGVLDTLRQADQIEKADESFILDAISRNMRRGKFLLLIVGDGIRENVEEMVDFLNETPQLQFTLALVELHVYELDGTEDKSRLVIPQIVARTREITRVVVRVEGTAIESVRVEVDTTTESNRRPGVRTPLTEEEFFEALGQTVSHEDELFAHDIIENMKNLGCEIGWQDASYTVRLPDPGGSRQMLSLVNVRKNGTIVVGFLGGQLLKVGVPEQIAFDFVRKTAQLFDHCEVHPKWEDTWMRGVPLSELRPRYDDFVRLIQEVIDDIRSHSHDH